MRHIMASDRYHLELQRCPPFSAMRLPNMTTEAFINLTYTPINARQCFLVFQLSHLCDNFLMFTAVLHISSISL